MTSRIPRGEKGGPGPSCEGLGTGDRTSRRQARSAFHARDTRVAINARPCVRVVGGGVIHADEDTPVLELPGTGLEPARGSFSIPTSQPPNQSYLTNGGKIFNLARFFVDGPILRAAIPDIGCTGKISGCTSGAGFGHAPTSVFRLLDAYQVEEAAHCSPRHLRANVRDIRAFLWPAKIARAGQITAPKIRQHLLDLAGDGKQPSPNAWTTFRPPVRNRASGPIPSYTFSPPGWPICRTPVREWSTRTRESNRLPPGGCPSTASTKRQGRASSTLAGWRAEID